MRRELQYQAANIADVHLNKWSRSPSHKSISSTDGLQPGSDELMITSWGGYVFLPRRCRRVNAIDPGSGARSTTTGAFSNVGSLTRSDRKKIFEDPQESLSGLAALRARWPECGADPAVGPAGVNPVNCGTNITRRILSEKTMAAESRSGNNELREFDS